MEGKVLDRANVEEIEKIGTRRWYLSQSTLNGMRELAEYICGANARTAKTYEECAEAIRQFYSTSVAGEAAGEVDEGLIEFILAAGLNWEKS